MCLSSIALFSFVEVPRALCHWHDWTSASELIGMNCTATGAFCVGDGRYALTLQPDLLTVQLSRTGRDKESGVVSLPEIAFALRILDALSVVAEVVLTWEHVNIAIEGHVARALLNRWSETEEPPALSIVSLELDVSQADAFRHLSHGLRAFTGQEIAFEFVSLEDSQEAARLLARVIRYALMHGPVSEAASFRSLDGIQLHATTESGGGAATLLVKQVL